MPPTRWVVFASATGLLLATPSCGGSSRAPDDVVAGAGGDTSGTAGQAAGGAAGTSPIEGPQVVVGAPGGPDGLDFMPLEDGVELQLQSFGQGGTHLLVAARCEGFGNRAFVSATLRNLVTGVEAAEPAPARPQLLFCDDANVCDLVPYLVHASGLTATDEERDGLHVRLTIKARNETGVMAIGSVEAVLSTANL